MYPHRIRLRGPWDYQPLVRFDQPTEPLPPGGRMTLPCRWREGGLESFTGRVRFIRRFGQPRRIDSHERVWLSFAGAEGAAEVWLNGHALGRPVTAGDPFEFEATAFLQSRNVLTIEVESRTDQGGLWGEVALEIRCEAFLRNVRSVLVREGTTGRLQLSGEVVGEHDRPLELYGLLNEATVVYTLVHSRPGGEPFRVVSEAVTLPEMGTTAPIVRVELVNGAICWYALEQRPDESARPTGS